jgi:uncharacterized protein
MKKRVFILLGWLFTGLALIGVVLPILPTTPFILLAGWLFARSSKRYERWLKSTSVYKRYAVPFLEAGGLSFRKKAELLITVYTVLLISGLLVANTHVRIFLGVLAIVKFIVLCRMPTVDPKKETVNS